MLLNYQLNVYTGQMFLELSLYKYKEDVHSEQNECGALSLDELYHISVIIYQKMQELNLKYGFCTSEHEVLTRKLHSH